METVLKTAPTAKPIALDEVKRHLRIDLDDTDHDDDLVGFIDSAIEDIEDLCWRKFITQTWYAYLDDWPKGHYIELPFGKLQSVTSVKYTDVDNSETTWSSAEYIVGTNYQKGRITLEDGYIWPNVVLYPSTPIKIEFVCGYGDTAASVPANIKHAMKVAIGGYFENREKGIVGLSYHELDTIDNLLKNYRLNEL